MKTLLKTKKFWSQFNIWLSHLYAETYKQSSGQLQRNNGYCCLGVGCILLIPEDKQIRTSTTELLGSFPKTQTYAPKWLKKINDDFERKSGLLLSMLNDGNSMICPDSYSHPEIAMLLQLVYIHKMLD